MQHLAHKEEVHFFRIAQSYIRMALQNFVQPSRAAPHRTNSHKGWQRPVYRSTLPGQTYFSFWKFQANSKQWVISRSPETYYGRTLRFLGALGWPGTPLTKGWG